MHYCPLWASRPHYTKAYSYTVVYSDVSSLHIIVTITAKTL